MCWEDIKIGRATSRQFGSTVLPFGATTLAIPRNLKRVALWINPNNTDGIFLSNQTPIAIPIGLFLPQAGFPVILTLSDHGAMVWDEWYATPNAVVVRLNWMEVVLLADGPNNLPNV